MGRCSPAPVMVAESRALTLAGGEETAVGAATQPDAAQDPPTAGPVTFGGA